MIYVVAPVDRIRCSLEALDGLLRQLDELAWSGGQPDMRRVFYERRPVGSGIPGGTGGGLSTGDVWVHPEFEAAGLRNAIADVLEGRRRRLRESGQ